MSQKHKFIFVHIPKTAGNSIQTSLLQFTEDSINKKGFDGVMYHKLGVNNQRVPSIGKHALLKTYAQHFNIDEYFKFVSVRNPWDRMLSWFFFDLEEKEFTHNGFTQFIKRMDPPELEMFHSQYDFICVNGEPKIDYVIKFENLKDDYKKLCEILKVPHISLFKLNASKNSRVNYKDYYNNENKSLVEKIFERDINYFNYEF